MPSVVDFGDLILMDVLQSLYYRSPAFILELTYVIYYYTTGFFLLILGDLFLY